jgi:hypothetical protein
LCRTFVGGGNRGRNLRKCEALARMLARGREPTLEIIASNLELADACAIERETIALIGRLEDGGPLTNVRPDGHVRQFARLRARRSVDVHGGVS